VSQLTHRSLCWIVGAALALAVLTPAPSRADTDPGPAPPASPPAATPPAASPPAATDAGDLWRRARHAAPRDEEQPAGVESHKPFFVVAPSVGSKPSTGVNAGLAGNVAFIDGDARATHISSMSAGLKVSQKGQTLSGFKLAMFTPNDRWFIQGDNRFSWTSQNTYGLGGNTPAADAENLKYDALRLYETAYRSVARGLFVGVGIDVNRHSNIRPGPGAAATFDQAAYVEYTEQHAFDLDRQTSSGTSVGVLFDTRDNGINARRGWLASATYRTFFDGFLGGDSTWQETSVDVRTYRALTRDGRHTLAFWFLGDFVTGGVPPYFDLPATAGDSYGRSARGYGEGRYRGDRLVYGEVEYRETITRNGLVGFVTFLNTTTIDSQTTGERLFDTFAPGAGLGLRFLLNKKSRTNLCADYGWGKQGSRGLYLAIQEAF
jgi:outer membrane protein assembly factor BamA